MPSEHGRRCVGCMVLTLLSLLTPEQERRFHALWSGRGPVEVVDDG